jgi:hypothetical protein
VPQEPGGNHLGGSLVQLGIGELAGPIDGNEEIELAFSRLHFGDVNVKVADRVALQGLFGTLVAFDIGQAENAVALQAAMQG